MLLCIRRRMNSIIGRLIVGSLQIASTGVLSLQLMLRMLITSRGGRPTMRALDSWLTTTVLRCRVGR